MPRDAGAGAPAACGANDYFPVSKERARAREARQAARAKEIEEAAKARARQERLRSLKPPRPQLKPRKRRYGAMPLRLQLGLVFGYLVVQWLAWQVFFDARARVGIAIVSLFAIPLIVVLTRTPPKGS